MIQLLTSAAAWQTLRDFWEMDGNEAAEAVAVAIDLLLAGARTHTTGRSTTAKARRLPARRRHPRREGPL